MEFQNFGAVVEIGLDLWNTSFVAPKLRFGVRMKLPRSLDESPSFFKK